MFNKINTKTYHSVARTLGLIIIHHQPINVPTAAAQAFLMDYT
jgi:hypothetical protein